MSKAEEIKKKSHYPESEKYATPSGGYVKDHEHYEFTPEELGELEAAIKSKTLQELKERVEGMEQQERIYADMCYNEALWRVIETIEELQDE